MDATPEELKEQIDQTRADLAVTVDALAEKVTPSPAAKRLSLAAAAGLLLALVAAKVRHRRAGG